MSEQATRQLFDISGAVEYLKSIGATGATKNFVRGLISSAQIPYLKVGKKFFVTRTSMDGWLARAEKRTRP